MAIQKTAQTERRAPLTRERILEAGVALADRGGLDNLSMRKLGQELGVDAMAIYRHVKGKDDLLDGVAEVVIGEIERRSRRRLDPRPARDRHGRPSVMLRHPGRRASSRNVARRARKPSPTSTRSWRRSSPAGSRWRRPTTRSTC